MIKSRCTTSQTENVMKSSKNQYDTIILGGGIIGVTAAYELSKLGQSVLILEKNEVGYGASGMSAAMLECQTDAHRGEPFFSLARASLNLFPRLENEIKKLTGSDFQYENCGILNLALSSSEAIFLKKEVKKLTALNLKAEWIEPDDLIKRYPNVDPDHFGGAFFGDDGQVNAERFLSTTLLAAKKLGTVVKTGFQKFQFNKVGQKIRGVVVDDSVFESNHLLLAAGAWTDQILSLLGIQLGIFPLRGQLLLYDTPRRMTPTPIYTKQNGYITPKKDGYTLVGTTVEEAGFDISTSESVKQELIEKGRRICPGFSRQHIRGMSAGLRPTTQSRLPIIGLIPEYPNLIVAAGHFRNGILLAPITAKIVTALIQNIEAPLDITPFSVRQLATPAV